MVETPCLINAGASRSRSRYRLRTLFSNPIAARREPMKRRRRVERASTSMEASDRPEKASLEDHKKLHGVTSEGGPTKPGHGVDARVAARGMSVCPSQRAPLAG